MSNIVLGHLHLQGVKGVIIVFSQMTRVETTQSFETAQLHAGILLFANEEFFFKI